MYMLQAGGVVLLVGDNTGLEFREVASKGAAQPFIIPPAPSAPPSQVPCRRRALRAA